LVLAHSVRAHLVLAHLVRALHLTPTARLAPAFRRAGLVLLASVAGCNPSVARVPVARLHPAVALLPAVVGLPAVARLLAVALHLTVDLAHGVGLHLALALRPAHLAPARVGRIRFPEVVKTGIRTRAGGP